MEELRTKALPKSQKQLDDNIRWIKEAAQNQLVVGSKARILYADAVGRREIARAFNKAIHDKKLSGPVVLSRDHHDVSGTDSPYRETSNVRDGSSFTADMAVQNFVGDAIRGATWVALHNGGGTGWGQAVNGGFGMVLDGSKEADERLSSMLWWDVLHGVTRRAWGRNENANEAIKDAMSQDPTLQVTLPNLVQGEDMELLQKLSSEYSKK